MNRIIITALAIVIAAAGIVWLATKKSDTAEPPQTTRAFAGTVINVNLEEMTFDGPGRITFRTAEGAEYRIALPSMGRSLCVAKDSVTTPERIAVGDAIEVQGEISEDGSIVPCMGEGDYLRVTGGFADTNLGITFNYRKGPNGYIVEKGPAAMSNNPSFVRGYIFTLESDYNEMQIASGTPREGPPVLTLRAYTNTDKVWATLWPAKHPADSNINLATGEPEGVVVGGANAVKYTTDGLYPTDVYVIANGTYIFVLTGSYLDQSSPQKADLEAIIESLEFVPEE